MNPQSSTDSSAAPVDYRYKTYDFVVMAFLAAISAVSYAGLAQVWTALTAATGPLGGSFLGLFQFGHLIAFAVLRKPGVALITSILTTVGQLLIGDPAGAYVLGWGVVHGLGAEAVFLAMRYRKPGPFTLCFAGGLAAVLGQLYTYWVYGWQDVMWMFYVSLPILFVSSAVESGLLAYYVSKALSNTRIIRPSGKHRLELTDKDEGAPITSRQSADLEGGVLSKSNNLNDSPPS